MSYRDKDTVTTVTFSPTNPHLLLSASEDNTVQQWGSDGYQIGSPIAGSHVAFSPDGTQFVSCKGRTVTIRNTDSRITTVEFNLAKKAKCCHFSPNGRFIAAASATTKSIIYLWDITGTDPYLFQIFNGHTDHILSLVFLSSHILVSTSKDESIKFWQISIPSVDPIAPDSEPPSPTPAPIRSVSIQAKDSLAFSIDSEGVVKIWDILTGCCKETHTTQARNIGYGDIHLISNRLAVVWSGRNEEKIHIWDTKDGTLQPIYHTGQNTLGLRITEDGSRIL